MHAAVAESGFEVSDVTGQKVLAVSDVPEDMTVEICAGPRRPNASARERHGGTAAHLSRSV